jgi:hypothetical protein
VEHLPDLFDEIFETLRPLVEWRLADGAPGSWVTEFQELVARQTPPQRSAGAAFERLASDLGERVHAIIKFAAAQSVAAGNDLGTVASRAGLTRERLRQLATTAPASTGSTYSQEGLPSQRSLHACEPHSPAMAAPPNQASLETAFILDLLRLLNAGLLSSVATPSSDDGVGAAGLSMRCTTTVSCLRWFTVTRTFLKTGTLTSALTRDFAEEAWCELRNACHVDGPITWSCVGWESVAYGDMRVTLQATVRAGPGEGPIGSAATKNAAY